MLSPFLETLSGPWYNESVYFRYRINKMPFWKRCLARLLFVPAGLARRLILPLRRRMEIPNVEMAVTIPCIPHRRDCATLNPAHPGSIHVDANCLIEDVRDFLANVDRVYRFTLTGFDTFRHRELRPLLRYLLAQDKIDLVHLFTTGSTLPGPELSQSLAHPKILVTISNYPSKGSIDKSRIIAILEQNNINYIVKEVWRNLGSFSPVADRSVQAARHRFSRCISKVHNLSNGEYHLCPRSAHGRRLGQLPPEALAAVPFRNRKNPSAFRKELKMLLQKDYLAACGTCEETCKDSILTKLSRSLPGKWYTENIYFKYHIHKIPLSKQDYVRLWILPIALIRGFYVSLRHRLEIPHVEMPITTRCNFRCKDCANLIPFYPEPADIALNRLIQDVKEFLDCVDQVYVFIIMGGETFLYRELHQLVSYLIRQDKINLVRLFTNGSIIPESDILQLLRHPKVLVTISSFPNDVSFNKPRFIATMEEKHINYNAESNLWNDLGGFYPNVDNTMEALKERFATCANKRCHNIMNGKYYLCPRAFHGEQLGQFSLNNYDSVVFRGGKDRQTFKKELNDLLHKDYLSACRKCQGTASDPLYPGIQMDGHTFDCKTSRKSGRN